MKNALLTFALFGLAGGAYAQSARTSSQVGPWVSVNNANVVTPPLLAIGQIMTLSPTFSWGLGYDAASPGSDWTRSIRASNAAGTEFSYNNIVGTRSYVPVNISVPTGVAGNNTAFCAENYHGATAGGGGDIIRTTNGGMSWHTISRPQDFANPDGYCNWVYAFDAAHLVAGGDPHTLSGAGQGAFEILWSSNADTVAATRVIWTQAVTPAPLSNEYLLVQSYTAVGNTIWAGTSRLVAGAPIPARVLRSTDQGHIWTAHNTPMLGSVQHLAFKDQLHGVAFTADGTTLQLMTTADGGLTWTMQTAPNLASADTLRGKFYQTGIAVVPNVGFISYGAAIPRSPRIGSYGASFSTDGAPTATGQSSWYDLDKSRYAYTAADFVQCSTGGFQGYLGGYTASGTAGIGGNGGLYQVSTTCALLATHAAPPSHPKLTVAPNPSADGHFQVQLAATLAPGTALTVADALGRTVLARELAAATQTVQLDLSPQQPGVYVLRLTSAAGTFTQKLVIQ